MILSVACVAQSAWSEEDAAGCKDHPLFNRMPGYRINNCETKEFDARDFPASAALGADNKPVKVETVEGVQTYVVQEMPGETKRASGLKIQRNYQNAVKAAGGVVIAEFGAYGSGKDLSDDIWGGGAETGARTEAGSRWPHRQRRHGRVQPDAVRHPREVGDEVSD